MRRMFQIDWRTWVAFAFSIVVMFVIVDRERTADTAEKLADENVQIRSDNAKERVRLSTQIRVLQARIDRLVEQNAELVRLFDEAGIDVPPSLVTTRRETITRDDDDSDDGGDTTVIVRPDPTTSPSSPRPNPTSTPPPTDGGTRVDVPDVPLPPQAGEATDTAKRIVDDVTGIDLD